MLPGFGAAHMRAMRRYDRLAVFTAMVHDETRGTVYLDGDMPRIRYRMGMGDREQLVAGLRACAQLLLAAGARQAVVPSVEPLTIRTDADLAKITLETTRPHALHLTAVHPMGAMHMGDDPKTAVVRSTGEHHQVRGLFVADGGLFPTSLGGPPQISIYAFAMHGARHVVDAVRRG
jgi:choline dehydrogenase-like flavoprotein